MANGNTYSWSFPVIDVYRQQGEYSDVVYNIHWILSGVDQTTSHSAQVYGIQSVPSYNPSSGSFIPFESLTEEVVTSWVRSGMIYTNAAGESVDRYYELTASIDTQIQDKINPPTLQLPPPWKQA